MLERERKRGQIKTWLKPMAKSESLQGGWAYDRLRSEEKERNEMGLSYPIHLMRKETIGGHTRRF